MELRDVSLGTSARVEAVGHTNAVIAGNANDALVIPAGLAFARAIAKRPDLELYQPDKRHPSLAGTYLAAATVLAALTKNSPVGSTYSAGLDGELAKFLQATAWETVQAYYGRQ